MGKCYIFSGDDDFLRKNSARTLAVKITGNQQPLSDPKTEIIAGDADNIDNAGIAGKFLSAALTDGLFVSERFIWLRNHPDLSCWDTPESPQEKEFLRFISSPLPENLTVLIDGAGADLRKKLYKDLQKSGVAIEIFSKSDKKNRGKVMTTLIDEFCRETGKRFSYDAREYFINAVGNDSGVLNNELEKLRNYTDDRAEISLKDCRAVTCKTQETLLWDYTNAVCDRDLHGALTALGNLFNQRIDGLEFILLGTLSKDFREMIKHRMEMQELHLTRIHSRMFDNLPENLKTEHPQNSLLKMHPYRAFKICERLTGCDNSSIARNLTLIRDFYRELVSSGSDRRAILEQLTIKLLEKNSKGPIFASN